jgi:hypothetical protein
MYPIVLWSVEVTQLTRMLPLRSTLVDIAVEVELMVAVAVMVYSSSPLPLPGRFWLTL